MTYAQIVKILSQTGLSPEQIGKRMGLSGMTIRRWHKEPSGRQVSEIHNGGLRDLVFSLIREGHVKADSASVTEALYRKTPRYIEAVMAHLGVSLDHLEPASGNGRAVQGLSQIGSDKAHIKEVMRQKQRIMAFKKMGSDWAERLESLWKVVAAGDVHTFEKTVAFGALFYLLTPFDLIHDYIPVFGFIDDYAVLGLAVAYYARRASRMTKGPVGEDSVQVN